MKDEEKMSPGPGQGGGDVTLGGRIFYGVAGALLLAAAPILLAYSSAKPAVLGRYSVPYAALLVLEITLGAGCLVLAALPEGAARRAHDALRGCVHSALGRPWALGSAIALLWAGAILVASQFSHVEVGKSAPLHALGAAAVAWVSFGAILAARTGARERARAIAKYAVFLFTAVLSLILCEAFLRKNPGLLPARILDRLPGGGEPFFQSYEFDDVITVGYRYRAGIPIRGRMMASEANLFVQQPDLLRPIPEKDDGVLLEASFTADENGYRNASPLLERYSIAVSGDSFTSLNIEPRPWPSILTEKLGSPVLNLGLPGYGPQQEAQALIRFGLPRRPEWLVLAYFEGNDLIDAENYELKRRSGLGWCEYDFARAGILERLATYHLAGFALEELASHLGNKVTGAEESYIYPFTATIAGRDVPLSFSTTYISRLELSREDVESLAGFRAAVEALRALSNEARAAGAKVIVAYFPSKERCYGPLLPATLLEDKLGNARRLMSRDRMLRPRGNDEVVSAAGLLERMDGQRDAVVRQLGAAGIEVLDLSPVFREAAARGEALYLTNDTHWSAAGHELAASAIAERLRRGR